MNEIAVVQSYDLTAIEDSAQIMADLKEELGADYRPDFAFAKTPSSARTVWDIKTSDDDEDPEMAKTIEGVILHAHKNYAWWKDKLDSGSGSGQPDCRSMDGITGIDQNGELRDCASCPYNKFGSDGAGKACKNGRRVYIIREGDMLPIRIDLAPTGNKPYEKYVDNLLLPRKKGQKPMRPNQVVTRIGLKVETNGAGTKYSVPTFECVGAVPGEARPALLKMAENLKQATQATFIQVPNDQIPAEFISEE